MNVVLARCFSIARVGNCALAVGRGEWLRGVCADGADLVRGGRCDVTTLWFETDAGDGFREPASSKERRLEPQITVGLVTDATGMPLMVDAFEGNRAETKTMIPMVQRFVAAHGIGVFGFVNGGDADDGRPDMNDRPRFNLFQSSLAAEVKTKVQIVLDMASVG
jgi:hypothetical protein